MVQVDRGAQARDSIVRMRDRLRETRRELAEAAAQIQHLTTELAEARAYHLAFSEGLLTAMVERELRHREECGTLGRPTGFPAPSQDSE